MRYFAILLSVIGVPVTAYAGSTTCSTVGQAIICNNGAMGSRVDIGGTTTWIWSDGISKQNDSLIFKPNALTPLPTIGDQDGQ